MKIEVGDCLQLILRNYPKIKWVQVKVLGASAFVLSSTKICFSNYGPFSLTLELQTFTPETQYNIAQVFIENNSKHSTTIQKIVPQLNFTIILSFTDAQQGLRATGCVYASLLHNWSQQYFKFLFSLRFFY